MPESDFPEIGDIESELTDLDKESKNINDKKRQLRQKREQLREELETLRDWIWKTNNPNIVALRRELLAAARLAYDETEEFDEEIEDDQMEEKATEMLKEIFEKKLQYKQYDLHDEDFDYHKITRGF